MTMEKKEITGKYQFAEDTARLIEAVKELDNVYSNVEACVDGRFASSWLAVYENEQPKDDKSPFYNPLLEKYKALRNEIEKVIHTFIDWSLEDTYNNTL